MPQPECSIPSSRHQETIDVEAEAAEHRANIKVVDLREGVRHAISNGTLSSSHHLIVLFGCARRGRGTALLPLAPFVSSTSGLIRADVAPFATGATGGVVTLRFGIRISARQLPCHKLGALSRPERGRVVRTVLVRRGGRTEVTMDASTGPIVKQQAG